MIGPIGPEEYEELCRRVGAVLADATPPAATVAVVSKGDPRLVEVEGREGRHFPADAEGKYAGYHPRTSEEAIAQIEEARRAGAEYLCFPATALWWLDHYQGLAGWLGSHCRAVAEDPETCVVYDLLQVPSEGAAEERFGAAAQAAALLDSLLPAGATVYAVGLAADELAGRGRTVAAIEVAAVAELRHRLEAAEPPSFLLVAGEGLPGAPGELERALAGWTRKIAQRRNLCDIFEVTGRPERSRLIRSPGNGDSAPGSTSQALGGEAADKLTNRLERLGFSRRDADAP
ncbi:MAG TPA: hypothetical protein VFN92_10370 [Solirubrobacterales bacterium]|nr:hypothetical protein [Solirubrobacterales bacterium]